MVLLPQMPLDLLGLLVVAPPVPTGGALDNRLMLVIASRVEDSAYGSLKPRSVSVTVALALCRQGGVQSAGPLWV